MKNICSALLCHTSNYDEHTSSYIKETSSRIKSLITGDQFEFSPNFAFDEKNDYYGFYSNVIRPVIDNFFGGSSMGVITNYSSDVSDNVLSGCGKEYSFVEDIVKNICFKYSNESHEEKLSQFSIQFFEVSENGELKDLSVCFNEKLAFLAQEKKPKLFESEKFSGFIMKTLNEIISRNMGILKLNIKTVEKNQKHVKQASLKIGLINSNFSKIFDGITNFSKILSKFNIDTSKKKVTPELFTFLKKIHVKNSILSLVCKIDISPWDYSQASSCLKLFSIKHLNDAEITEEIASSQNIQETICELRSLKENQEILPSRFSRLNNKKLNSTIKYSKPLKTNYQSFRKIFPKSEIKTKKPLYSFVNYNLRNIDETLAKFDSQNYNINKKI